MVEYEKQRQSVRRVTKFGNLEVNEDFCPESFKSVMGEKVRLQRQEMSKLRQETLTTVSTNWSGDSGIPKLNSEKRQKMKCGQVRTFFFF